jgi:hypothetical protein
MWEETKAALKVAKEKMAGRDLDEVPESFEEGERVWLDSWNL